MVLAEAELVRVVYELMSEFEFMPPYYIRINHMALNEAIFTVNGIVDATTRHAVNRIISLLGREPWSEITSRLKCASLASCCSSGA